MGFWRKSQAELYNQSYKSLEGQMEWFVGSERTDLEKLQWNYKMESWPAFQMELYIWVF